VAVPEVVALPAEGVYAGWCIFPGGYRRSAISLGARPTYYPNGGPLLLEAHLLDFDGDLYGVQVAVRFARHLRGQLRFGSSEELVAQIEADVAATRAAMSGEQP
jgi:FAD synthase